MNDTFYPGFGELLPEINELNAPFWQGLSQGELRLLRCGGCGAHQYPPESFCYECGSRDLSWVAVEGKGTVYSYIVVHQVYHKAFKPYVPYTVAIVQLDEGPHMLTAMLELNRNIAIGERVKPLIRHVDGERAFLSYVPERD